MTITDDNLKEILHLLRPSERKVIARHVMGERTPESWQLIRQLRRKLKRKVRNRVRRFAWLA